MSKDNEKIIQQILNRVEDTLISKTQLEEILCDVVKRFHIERIDDNNYNLEQIISFYKEDMEMREFSPRTIKNRMYTLRHFCEFINKDIQDITVVDLKAFLNHKKKTVKASTVNGFIDLLKGFFSWCMEEDYIETNPAKKLKKLRQGKRFRDPLSMEDVEKLRMGCKTDRERALVEFMLSTGMRASEIVNVKVSDLDFYTNQLKTIGKGDKERVVLFNDKCKLYLTEYLKNRKGESDALFCSERKPYRSISVRGLEKIIKKISERKITDTTVFPHKIRHTFATSLFTSGADLTTIQFLLGHESIATTQIYVKTSLDRVSYQYNKCLAI